MAFDTAIMFILEVSWRLTLRQRYARGFMAFNTAIMFILEVS